MEIAYKIQGDYQIPDLRLDETNESYGKYGMMRRTYLKNHRQGTYQSLLLQGKLMAHLAEIDQTARAQVEHAVTQMLKTSPAPDKASDQMGWVAHMNSLKAQAEEMVTRELIYS